MTGRTRRPRTRALAVVVAAALAAAACSGGSGSSDQADSDPDGLGDPGNCTVIDAAVSSEKIDLMVALAKAFNGSEDAQIDGGCAFVRPYSKASGGATDLLAAGWEDESEGPQPVIWSPAASSWGQILNQRLADDGQPPMASADAPSFQLTPLVIAMPEPMARALGHPDEPIGWGDIARLATSEEGWAAYGHPEWGRFRLGKTNPNFSTSGLSALIGQSYAATGKTRGLTSEDLASAEVRRLATDVESSVVHYGDITMTFLNNWFRTDRQGTSLRYASAVAVEEKSVIDYNKGNPDGVLEPGEKPREPRIPLVAIYPKEGTLYSDSPLYVLDAPWVSSKEREGARAFVETLQRPEAQRRVLEFGFRPGNPDVPVKDPISPRYGVDPEQPSTLLQVPEPKVMIDLLARWREQRKGARVMLVLDVSGSMAEPADPADPDGPTRLDLAQRAAIESLDEFKADDEVGLRIFTTNLGPGEDLNFVDVLPIRPMRENRERMRATIRDQMPLNATPLYDVTKDAFDDLVREHDESKINAVVLLTDGMNDDGNQNDDAEQLRNLLAHLRDGTEGERAKPVRVFTIGYGKGADQETLQRIAEATNAAAYEATDPRSITKVFTAVVSNF